MATTKQLIEINYHTDTETGDSHVGEVDFGITGALGDYIEQYGIKGVLEITSILSFLIYVVRNTFEEQHQQKHTFTQKRTDVNEDAQAGK